MDIHDSRLVVDPSCSCSLLQKNANWKYWICFGWGTQMISSHNNWCAMSPTIACPNYEPAMYVHMCPHIINSFRHLSLHCPHIVSCCCWMKSTCLSKWNSNDGKFKGHRYWNCPESPPILCCQPTVPKRFPVRRPLWPSVCRITATSFNPSSQPVIKPSKQGHASRSAESWIPALLVSGPMPCKLPGIGSQASNTRVKWFSGGHGDNKYMKIHNWYTSVEIHQRVHRSIWKSMESICRYPWTPMQSIVSCKIITLSCDYGGSELSCTRRIIFRLRLWRHGQLLRITRTVVVLWLQTVPMNHKACYNYTCSHAWGFELKRSCTRIMCFLRNLGTNIRSVCHTIPVQKHWKK